MELRRATTANDLDQATAISNVLSEAGIAATLRGGLHDAYPGSSGLGAIDVLVSEQDLTVDIRVIAEELDLTTATSLQELLESGGINAEIVGGHNTAFPGTPQMGGYGIMVAAPDVDEARRRRARPP